MKHLTKFWLVAVLAVGGAAMVSWFFGLPKERLMYPVVAIVGWWLVVSVVGFFQAQRREIEKLRDDVKEIKRFLDEELERT